jgi:hypothetical protein
VLQEVHAPGLDIRSALKLPAAANKQARKAVSSAEFDSTGNNGGGACGAIHMVPELKQDGL